MTVRVDKWLQVARIYRTRSQATKACQQGKVKIDGQKVKPHRAIAVGDRVEVEKGEWVRVLVVRALADRPVAKAEARELYEDLSPPPPPPDPIRRLLRIPAVKRERGAGRPTKRERRRLERLRGE
ncbi:MAG: S4 domain-containing protein [Thermoanaerobaculia bacterium]|nr:S4 domain-containing protein [Thermoanaerobaculia bacterium]